MPTYGNGQFLVAWSDATAGVFRILAARVSAEGVVLDRAPMVVAEHEECAAPAPPDWYWERGDVHVGASGVTFHGERSVLGWMACGPASTDLFGALVDPDGAVPARFSITADAHPDEPPALGGTGAGTSLVASSSFRAEAPLGAWRLYTRRLGVVRPPDVVCSARP